GDHGEIMACLIDVEGCLRAWVMSCRVLQRQVEAAFLHVLTEQPITRETLVFDRVNTERNRPLQDFLDNLVPNQNRIERDRLAQQTQAARALFTLHNATETSPS
ncbi:MAG: hypothetical protein R3311_17840, partial [Oceanisphaera sp.]|nr:hypothetical protein [Oceanisphaera sp.]